MSIHPPITGAEAADRLAIRELVDSYAHCADRRDAKGQMALFTEDTHFVVYMDTRNPEPTQDLHGRATRPLRGRASRLGRTPPEPERLAGLRDRFAAACWRFGHPRGHPRPRVALYRGGRRNQLVTRERHGLPERGSVSLRRARRPARCDQPGRAGIVRAILV